MRISSGLLEPGARVPSRNAIIARYGVGETAAKHALAVLAAEGLIEARPGSGSYVRHAPVTRYLEHGRLGHPGSPFGLAGPVPAGPAPAGTAPAGGEAGAAPGTGARVRAGRRRGRGRSVSTRPAGFPRRRPWPGASACGRAA